MVLSGAPQICQHVQSIDAKYSQERCQLWCSLQKMFLTCQNELRSKIDRRVVIALRHLLCGVVSFVVKRKIDLAGCKLLRRKLSLFCEANHISTFILLSVLTTFWLLFCGSSSFGFVFVDCPCLWLYFAMVYILVTFINTAVLFAIILVSSLELALFSPHTRCYYQIRNSFCLLLARAIIKTKKSTKATYSITFVLSRQLA